MNTIRIYLTESGRIADLQKDFPLYQGQFQNKLLNVFVPTSILAPIFTSSGAVSADYVASTSTKIGMTYTARDGSIKTSKNYYMRYLKTLMYKGVEYALYERKLPKEFTFYAGQGENSPVLIINVVNIEQQSGDTPPLVLSVITSQTCHLDVMQSTFLDRDELNEPSELENLNAQVQALNAIMPLKQDKEDNNIDLKQKPVQKTVVGAINDLGELVETAQTAADANKAEIGNLTALTTDEKATLVGAINEVDNHADNATTLANNAVATANSAVATANEAKTTAQTAENNANSAVDKANDAVGKANEAIMKADAKATSIGFMTAKDAVTALNGYPRTQLKGGDTIWIVEDGTPDLWVTEVAQESVPYNYTTKDKFNQDLVDNKVLQIGYFKTAYQESDGKPVTIAWQNVLVKSTDWVASTEFADFPYEAKIELTDFVDYTTVPQVVFDIADTMSGNYAPICKSGDKCVYIYGKVQNEITLKTVITFAPNVNGASVTGGGYNNRGKWVASTTYAIDDLVYTDNGQYVCIEGITSTTSPEQDTQHWQATFVATGKTKNGLKFSGQDNGTGVQKTFDGSTAVEVAFDETTMTAKEVNGVLKVGAKGTVPEALPQEASALKSGNLPTTGWNAEYSADVFKGTYTNNGSYPNNFYEIPNATAPENKAKLYVTFSDNSTTEMGGTYYSDLPGWQYGSSSTPTGNLCYIRIKTNGQVLGALGGNTITRIATYPISDGTIYNYTISDTSITANSDVLMELTDDGGVKALSIEVGKITVVRDSIPTNNIPYTYKVKQTNASGQFTLVNHMASTLTALPQEASALKNGSLPTNGWNTIGNTLWTGNKNAFWNTNSVIYTVNVNINDFTQPLTFGVQYNTSGTKTATVASIESDHSVQTFIHDGHTFSTLVYADKVVGNGVDKGAGSLTSISIGRQTYTISDTSITANSDVLMELTDDGGVKAYSMEAGKITVIRDTVPTSPIPYTYKVKQTNASGQFTLVNHFVPSIPENPTSLPVSYKKVSGELPTSGWSTLDEGWKGNTLPASEDWRRVTYGNGKFVAVTDGTGRCAYSTDGISWNETSLPTSRRWFGVTYGDGKFVAVALSTDKGAYSTDGIIWNEFTLPASQGWHSVTYGNGKFVAVAGESSTGAYSTDGITWSTMTLPTSQSWYGVTYGDGKFIAVAVNSNKGAYSTDGITWTEMSMPESAPWFNVVYGNGKFVAITQGLTIAAYSANGTAWSKITLPISASEGIAYGDGKFVVVPNNSNYGAYSTDGINWTQMSMPTSQSWRYVTYGNGKFVAVAQSANGAYWKAAAQVTYSISDTDITANTAVKMYLTDEGGVKAQSKAVGSIQVIRDSVPTVAIPYEYEVEQTSAEGLFEVINAYVPTKTSELTNDSGFITAADIPTVGEWVDVTGETATLTQAGTYQVLFGSSNSVQSIIYWDGTNGADGIYSTMPSVTSGRPFINCRYPHITAAGVLSINYDTITEENGTWTKTTSTLSGFKYRKIN